MYAKRKPVLKPMNKLTERIVTLLLVIGIGFGIYQSFLKPKAKPESQAQSEQQRYSTEGFFTLALQSPTGEQAVLKRYEGKVIIVNFWATWCPPCREEMPDLSAVYEQYQDKNVVVLGLAIDELEAVKTFQTETPVSYPLYIAEDEGMPLSAQLGNRKGVLPYTAIIDNSGQVAWTFYGKVDQKMLQTALKRMQ